MKGTRTPVRRSAAEDRPSCPMRATAKQEHGKPKGLHRRENRLGEKAPDVCGFSSVSSATCFCRQPGRNGSVVHAGAAQRLCGAGARLAHESNLLTSQQVHLMPKRSSPLAAHAAPSKALSAGASARGRTPTMDAFVRVANASPQFSFESAAVAVREAMARAKASS